MKTLNESVKLFYIECVPYVCVINPKTDKAVIRKAMLIINDDMVQFRLNNEIVWAKCHR